jgi:UDP-N-acetylmuramoyl-L-alanyl-D-glutamate--2,6-diaminopimelate ligase
MNMPLVHPMLHQWPVTARDALPMALWTAAEIAAATGGTASHDFQASGVEMDSRDVKPFSLFVAVTGTTVDGHSYIDKAIASGAVAIVCEKIPDYPTGNITFIQVQNSAAALGYIASNFFDNPSEKIQVVAVTGTNGKTTTATLMHRLARKMGFKAGLLSTVVNKINDTDVPSTHTTPNAIALNALLAEMVAAGCTYCFMEAS